MHSRMIRWHTFWQELTKYVTKSKADHYYYQNEPARKNHADGKG